MRYISIVLLVLCVFASIAFDVFTPSFSTSEKLSANIVMSDSLIEEFQTKDRSINALVILGLQCP